VRMYKRDAIVLIGLLAFVLLNVGALSLGGHLRAKTLLCQANMKEIGSALTAYCDTYDGAMPTLEYPFNPGPIPYISHYYIQRRDVGGQVVKWCQLGCLYSSGLISDARTFYCPAAKGSSEEHLSYCDPAPWGTLPQNGQQNVVNQWVRAWKGYIYWPQSKDVYKTAGEIPGSAYQVGYPRSATMLDRLDQTKAIAADIVLHPEGGYKVNALFFDGCLKYQDAPSVGGKSWYYNAAQEPDGAPFSADWTSVTVAEWMYALTR
jgi:hypothetical protein